MRIIKFRGKDAKTGEWVCGDLHLLCDKPHIHTEPAPYPYAGRRSFVIQETIGQFTGLTDRNGIDVYEGDILMIDGIRHPRYHLVSWDERRLTFNMGDTPLYAYLHGDTLLREYIVCGNRYDNPELLKENNQ